MRELRTLFLNGSLKCERTDNPQEDDFFHRLAAEVVCGAIHDWRLLINRKAWLDYDTCKVNFNALRLFFKSDWCSFLMQDFDIEPAAILDLLEKELQDAMSDPKSKSKKNKRNNR
jgi:hypothetical protein